MKRPFAFLARLHIWLGWLVGVPLLMWCLTGLGMVMRPIEEVRGEHLRRDPPVLATAALTFPGGKIGAAQAAILADQPDGPVWIVTEADGRRLRYSALDGAVAAPVIDSEARRIAAAAYAGTASLAGMRYFPADLSPTDLRAPFPAWQARYDDGTHLYIRADTGEVVAVRTRWWRTYDFLWGLHIMDLETREDTHHPVLIAFAALGAIGAAMGCILMFRRRKARVV